MIMRLLDQKHYCVVNVWTSEKNKALQGDNVGHASIETHLAYYSLWPQRHTAEEVEAFQAADAKEQDRIRKENRSNFYVRPADFKADYHSDVVAEDREADARIIFYSLDEGKMNQYFTTSLRPSVVAAGGWRMAGSNVISRIGNSPENCVSLVYRLLVAGGLENLVGKLAMSTIGSQNSVAVTPDNVLKQILYARLGEQEKYPEIKEFAVNGISESDITELCRLHEVVGVKISAPDESSSAPGCRLM
jgi:hypothetical protein